MSEDEVRKNYPDLMAIVETKVKPERLKQKDKVAKEKWWQFTRARIDLYKAIAHLDRVLVTNAQASTHLSFTFYSSKVVFANSLNVFPFDQYSAFAILQSRIHEVFARFFSSSMKDDLRYNPSDCFETFPFPENWENPPAFSTPLNKQGVFKVTNVIGIFSKKIENFIIKFSLISIRYHLLIQNKYFLYLWFFRIYYGK
jgi:hypothetical protein